MANEWKFLSTVLLRGTGFPFSYLKPFRFKKTSAHLKEMSVLSSDIETLAQEIRKKIHEAISNPAANPEIKYDKIRSKVHRKLSVQEHHMPPATDALHGILLKWNALLAQFEALKVSGAEVFEKELLEIRNTLKEFTEGNALFREAMAMSTMESSEIVFKSYTNSNLAVRNMKTRGRERFFMSYLQRFCTKNDTNSFFGPINYAKFAPGNSKNLTLEASGSENGKNVAYNQVFFSHWAVQELSRAVSREEEFLGYVVPKLLPYYVLHDDGVYYFGLEKLEIPPMEVEILNHITRNGHRKIGDIQRIISHEAPESFAEAIRSLAKKEMIADYPIISPHSDNGVIELLAFLNEVPDSEEKSRWVKELQQLDALRIRVKDSPFPERMEKLQQSETLFESLTQGQAERRKGNFYADRSIFFEECRGVIEKCEIGGKFFADLQTTLEPALEIFGLIAAARWEMWQHVAKEILIHSGGPDTTIPLNEFWNDFEENYEKVKATERFQELQAGVTRAISILQDAVRVGNPLPSAIPQAKQQLQELGLLKHKEYPLCLDLDFLIGSRSLEALNAGDYTLYLGEIHPQLFPNFYITSTYFCPWRDEYIAEFQRVIQRLTDPYDTLHLLVKRDMKLYPTKFKGSVLYLQEPGHEEEGITPVSLYDLEVANDDQQVVLRHKSNGKRYVFPGHMVTDPNYEFLRIFTLPYVEYVPLLKEKSGQRLVFDKLVYQRASWHLQSEELKGLLEVEGFELFWKIFQMKENLGMPSCVFVRHPLERKPFFLDLENFFLIELFQHMLRQAPVAWMSEFAPGEEELWLETAGEKYCVEFRSGVYSRLNLE